LLICLWAMINPGTSSAIVANLHGNAEGLLEKAESFLKEIGILESSARNIMRLTNGSKIVCMSAKGDVGLRSKSFQFLMLSEVDFWETQKTYGELLQTASLNARILVESTADGPDGPMCSLWNTPSHYKKIFFSVEDHAQYRSNHPITDEEWEDAQKRGYTDRSAASWFLHKVQNDFVGNIIAAQREYPQRPEHAFSIREGRWIQRDPDIIKHTLWNHFSIFEEPQPYHCYAAGLDTAFGVGADSHAIMVFDRSNGRLVASMKSNNIPIDDLINRAEHIHHKYKLDYLTIEYNGIGQFAYTEALKRNLPTKQHTTNQHNQYAGLLTVKRQVEAGLLAGGPDFLDECKSLTYFDSGRKKQFDGRKDMCMAAGIVLPDILAFPHKVVLPTDPNVFRADKYLKKNTTWF
jgi:hypothetical protein